MLGSKYSRSIRLIKGKFVMTGEKHHFLHVSRFKHWPEDLKQAQIQINSCECVTPCMKYEAICADVWVFHSRRLCCGGFIYSQCSDVTSRSAGDLFTLKCRCSKPTFWRCSGPLHTRHPWHTCQSRKRTRLWRGRIKKLNKSLTSDFIPRTFCLWQRQIPPQDTDSLWFFCSCSCVSVFR